MGTCKQGIYLCMLLFIQFQEYLGSPAEEARVEWKQRASNPGGGLNIPVSSRVPLPTEIPDGAQALSDESDTSTEHETDAHNQLSIATLGNYLASIRNLYQGFSSYYMEPAMSGVYTPYFLYDIGFILGSDLFQYPGNILIPESFVEMRKYVLELVGNTPCAWFLGLQSPSEEAQHLPLTVIFKHQNHPILNTLIELPQKINSCEQMEVARYTDCLIKRTFFVMINFHCDVILEFPEWLTFIDVLGDYVSCKRQERSRIHPLESLLIVQYMILLDLALRDRKEAHKYAAFPLVRYKVFVRKLFGLILSTFQLKNKLSVYLKFIEMMNCDDNSLAQASLIDSIMGPLLFSPKHRLIVQSFFEVQSAYIPIPEKFMLHLTPEGLQLVVDPVSLPSTRTQYYFERLFREKRIVNASAYFEPFMEHLAYLKERCQNIPMNSSYIEKKALLAQYIQVLEDSAVRFRLLSDECQPN